MTASLQHAATKIAAPWIELSEDLAEGFSFYAGYVGDACNAFITDSVIEDVTLSEAVTVARHWPNMALDAEVMLEPRRAAYASSESSECPGAKFQSTSRTTSRVPSMLSERSLENPRTQQIQSEEALGKRGRGRGKRRNLAQCHQCDDLVTSFMLCNLPCGITLMQLSEVIDSHGLQGSYDLLYLPCKLGKTIGYGFINLLDASQAEDFEKVIISVGNSLHKQVQVKPAHIQGFANNLRHFGHAKQAREMLILCNKPSTSVSGAATEKSSVQFL